MFAYSNTESPWQLGKTLLPFFMPFFSLLHPSYLHSFPWYYFILYYIGWVPIMCQRLYLVLGIGRWIRYGSCPQYFTLRTGWNHRGRGEMEKRHKGKCHEAGPSKDARRWEGRESLVLPGRASLSLQHHSWTWKHEWSSKRPSEGWGWSGLTLHNVVQAPKYEERLKKGKYLIVVSIECTCKHQIIWCTAETKTMLYVHYISIF